MIDAKGKRNIIDGYGKLLDKGKGLSQDEHEIREQAYNVETTIEKQEVEVGNTDMKLRQFDVIEIFRALTDWANKQEKEFWDKQISH